MKKMNGVMKMKNKTIGFYMTLIAAILSIVACVLYGSVMYTLPVVYVFCVIAAVLAVVVIIFSVFKPGREAYDFLSFVYFLLMVSAAVWLSKTRIITVKYRL